MDSHYIMMFLLRITFWKDIIAKELQGLKKNYNCFMIPLQLNYVWTMILLQQKLSLGAKLMSTICIIYYSAMIALYIILIIFTHTCRHQPGQIHQPDPPPQDGVPGPTATSE